MKHLHGLLGILALFFASPTAAQSIMPQGRLTLTSGASVMQTSVSGATKFYYTRYLGAGDVPLYDGTNYAMFSVPELQVDLGSNWAARSLHNVFVGDDAGTKRLCTADAATSELVNIQGIVLNSGTAACRYNNSATFNCAALRCTYLGRVRLGAVAGIVNYVFGDALLTQDFNIWNAYNQSDNWSYTVVDPNLMYTGGPASTDPYAMYSLGTWGWNEVYDYRGRMQVLPPSLVPGEHTTVVIFWGDSLAAPTEKVTYAPGNAKVQDFSLENGGVYQARAPALSCSRYGSNTTNGFWGHRLGDKLIAAEKTQRFIGVCASVSGSSTLLWTNFAYYNRFGVAYRRLDSIGLLSANKVIIVASIGGADQDAGASTATVKANLDTIISKIRAAGFASTPIYLALSSWGKGGTGGVKGLNVRTGIMQAIVGNANVFAGADTDTIPIGERYDGSHFDGTGSDHDATLWFNVIQGSFP